MEENTSTITASLVDCNDKDRGHNANLTDDEKRTMVMEFKLEPTRWYILAIFVIINCNQCLTWFTFSSIDADVMKEYFGDKMTSRQIDLLLNWGPIIAVLCFPIQAHVLNQRTNGLQKSIVLGALLVFLGNIIRIMPIWVDQDFRTSKMAFAFYHLGQISNAAAGCFIMSAVTRLSSVWFAEKERVTATAIAQMSNGVGTTIGFVLGPLLVKESADVPRLMWLGLVVSTFTTVCVCVHFPSEPSKAPSVAAMRSRENFEACRGELETDAIILIGEREEPVGALYEIVASMRHSMKYPSYVVLVLSAGALSGAQSAWQGVLQSTLNPAGYDDGEVGWMGFANGATQALSSILAGYLIDRVFVRRMKIGILVGIVAILVTSVLFMLSTPCFVYDDPPLPTTFGALLCLMLLNGFANGVTSPLFYELAAELIYPLKEGVSGGTIVFVLNFVSCLVIFIDMALSYRYINFFYCLTIGLLLVATAFVREDYRRPFGVTSNAAMTRDKVAMLS